MLDKYSREELEMILRGCVCALMSTGQTEYLMSREHVQRNQQNWDVEMSMSTDGQQIKLKLTGLASVPDMDKLKEDLESTREAQQMNKHNDNESTDS